MNIKIAFIISILIHIAIMIAMYISILPAPRKTGTAAIIHSYVYFDSGLLTQKMKQGKGRPAHKNPESNNKHRQKLTHRFKAKHNIQKIQRQRKQQQQIEKITQHAKIGKKNPLLILLHNLIQNHQHYPLAAKLLKKEGSIKVKFTLLPTGEIHHIVILQSSGNQSLDKAAYQAVAASNPVMQAKKYIHTKKELTTWIRFKINQY